MEKELFALLRLGLETRTTEEESLSDFTVMSTEQWEHVIDLARKQGVLGIVLDGINRLEVSGEHFTGLSKQLRLQVIGEVLQLEQRNKMQMAVMNEMAAKWQEKGCRVMVMKGQANGTLYPKPEHRNPGDIDCYLFENYAVGNEIAKASGADVDESWYKHSVIRYKGETFENHQYFVHTRDGKRGKRLEKEMEDELVKATSSFLPLTTYTVMPPVQWNAMFLTYHACAHFLSEGLRLKQILDWAMFLKNCQQDVDWEAFYAYCERNHLRRFADAATAISAEHLGIRITAPSITYSSPYAEKILHSALYDDDYVFGSGEGSWHNRWHLVRNLFHHRWKYEDIYETSPWRQLWYYATGYLFKTE